MDCNLEMDGASQNEVIEMNPHKLIVSLGMVSMFTPCSNKIGEIYSRENGIRISLNTLRMKLKYLQLRHSFLKVSNIWLLGFQRQKIPLKKAMSSGFSFLLR